MNGAGVPRIMVFRPTWEEFKDFNKYILYMESQGAHKAGLAKVVPPPEWNPCPGGYDHDAIDRMQIPAPICQVVNGKQGLYQQFNIQKKATTVREFKKMARSPKYDTPPHFDYEDLERKYWKNITYVSPLYGADVSGSLTDPSVKEWNINKLGSILDFVSSDYEISIDGVNTAYLYFGMWKTSFAWHTEDMDLYSINYLHFGAPKSWYAIPPDHGPRLERCANGYFSGHAKECPAFLRHKMTIISPQILKNYSIPFNKITQEAGEFMVTFPYGYHAGFNHGFNCAESTNFASPRWVEYGKRAAQCYCRDDMVRISMDTFVKRFQPEKYDLWVQGIDMGAHPNNPNNRHTAAKPPSLEDILCNKNNKSASLPQRFGAATAGAAAAAKTKAKRHLVHDKAGQDAGVDEAVKIKEAPTLKDEEETVADVKTEETPIGAGVEPAADAAPAADDDDEDVEEPPPDEQTLEFFRDIWYKAEETESDGLPACNVSSSDEDALEADLGGAGAEKKARQRSVTASASSKSRVKAAGGGGAKLKRAKSASLSASEASTLKRSRKKAPQPSPPPPLAPVQPTTLLGPPLPGGVATLKPLAPYKIPKKAAPEAAWTPTAAAPADFPSAAEPWRLDAGPAAAAPRVATKPTPPSARRPRKQPSPHNSRYFECRALGGYHGYHDPHLSPGSPWMSGNPGGASSSTHASSSSSTHASSSSSTHASSSSTHTSSSSAGCPGDAPTVTTSSANQAWPSTWTPAQEADYNLFQSLCQPFCCVCSVVCRRPALSASLAAGALFEPSARWRQQAAAGAAPPVASAVRIPDACFAKRWTPDGTAAPSPTTSSVTLYRCSVCRVCVHGHCYGLTSTTTTSTTSATSWLCRRCDSDARNAVCGLCGQRGGALQPTRDRLHWTHVVCVLAGADQPLDVAAGVDPPPSCVYCAQRKGAAAGVNPAGLVRCSVKRCPTAFHVVCAVHAGARFVWSAGAGRLTATCPHHGQQHRPHHLQQQQQQQQQQQPIHLLTKVWARHPRSRRYQMARVTETATMAPFYWVDFADGTTSTDTYPEDIVNYRCRDDGPPPHGAHVHVLWTDGKPYEGIFRGVVQRKVYKVTFKDGPSLSLERSEFYLMDEPLPKKVRESLFQSPIATSSTPTS